MSDDQQIPNIDTLLDADQPSDLFAYIGQQQFSQVNVDDQINYDDQTNADVQPEAGQQTDEQNVEQVAETTEQPAEPTTQPVVAEVESDKTRQTESETFQQERRAMQSAFVQMAKIARDAEDRAFEAGLANMDESEQAIARANRKAELAEKERDYFRQELTTASQKMDSQNQLSAKGQVAYKLAERFQLPAEEIPTLLDAENPRQMMSYATKLGELYTKLNATTQAREKETLQQNIDQRVKSGVDAAGGEAAPAAPAKKTPHHSNDLFGLFGEREYIVVPATG